jgi:sugar/nucleoside kinase (ribokinase family)
MARFSPPDHLRIAQAMPGLMEVAFAGAEANAAVAVARLGGRAEFVSALPRNEIADAAVAALREAGVGVGRVLRSDSGRCGLYFVETGANQRGGLVVYRDAVAVLNQMAGLSISSNCDGPNQFFHDNNGQPGPTPTRQAVKFSPERAPPDLSIYGPRTGDKR